jgi:hypothetical protein
VAFSPSDPLTRWSLGLFARVLVYSLGSTRTGLTPVRFAPGWGIAQHGFDLAAFSLFNFFTDAAKCPFFGTYLPGN